MHGVGSPSVLLVSSGLTPPHLRMPELPELGNKRLAMRITKDALRHVRAGHPWVYDESITSISHPGVPGDLAVIFDEKRRFNAIGLFDPNSPIRIKILHRGSPATIDRAWWAKRIDDALELRASLVDDETTTGYRVLNGENDGFPGLVADRYDDTLVVKIYTTAWLPHLRSIVETLIEATAVTSVVLRTARSVEVDGLSDGDVVFGPTPDNDDVWFFENGLTFLAHPRFGQKTGFFLDQRDNRARVREASSGASVLDVFSCTGGFSAAAAVGGATHVTSIDMAPNAIETAERVMLANDRTVPWEGLVGDAFDVMHRLRAEKRRFGVVVVDPPSFAQRQANVSSGLRAYGKLTDLALTLVEPGGLLVQASCSSRIVADDFFTKVRSVAEASSRRLIEIERTGHAIDHPVTFTEGAYLKALFARID